MSIVERRVATAHYPVSGNGLGHGCGPTGSDLPSAHGVVLVVVLVLVGYRLGKLGNEQDGTLPLITGAESVESVTPVPEDGLRLEL